MYVILCHVITCIMMSNNVYRADSRGGWGGGAPDAPPKIGKKYDFFA